MSFSLNNLPKINNVLEEKDIIIQKEKKREESTEKLKPNLNLKYLFYEKNEKIITKDLCILNFITNDNDKKYSGKTLLSETAPDLKKYESGMVKKYSENFNSNLSFISEFNLEENNDELDDSFNSSNNECSEIEQIEIKAKSSKLVNSSKFDDDNNLEFEKEWKYIKDFLLNKRLKKID